MKKIIIKILPIFIFTQLFAVGGFGLQLGQSIFSVDKNLPINDTDADVYLTNGAFSNALNLGGYLYLDILPILDLELDFNFQSNKYDINFSNPNGNMNPINFGWASSNIYYTMRKKVIGGGIPLLAKAQLFAGFGFNSHSTTPLANEEMIKSLLNDDLSSNPEDLNKNLENYLTNKDNYVSSTGYHLQTGLQFKLLMLDSFLFYRHIFVEDVIPGSKNFGSFNLRFGAAF